MLVMLAALLAPAAHAQAPAVGDTGPGGGKVFYMDANIYLEAAPSNWGGETTGRRYATGTNAIITAPGGATGTAIGTGYANSVAIANQTGNVAATCAAVAAREYTGGGLTDWFLPSIDELLELRAQSAIADFPTGQLYWSSTEKDNDEAWMLWDNCAKFDRPKNHSFRTRPIRMGTTGTGGTTYADWATANGVIGDPNGDSNNDGVQNGIAYFMNDTGRITNPSLNVGNTVTVVTIMRRIPHNHACTRQCSPLRLPASASLSDS